MRLRRPGISRVGSISDARPVPLPKNRLEARIEAQQKTIRELEADKTKLKNVATQLIDLIQNDIISKLPKKMSAEVSKALEEIKDELD